MTQSYPEIDDELHLAKGHPDFLKDIAYIYEILHCNHFMILSNATAYETTTINIRCLSTVVVSMIHPV